MSRSNCFKCMKNGSAMSVEVHRKAEHSNHEVGLGDIDVIASTYSLPSKDEIDTRFIVCIVEDGFNSTRFHLPLICTGRLEKKKMPSSLPHVPTPERECQQQNLCLLCVCLPVHFWDESTTMLRVCHVGSVTAFQDA